MESYQQVYYNQSVELNLQSSCFYIFNPTAILVESLPILTVLVVVVVRRAFQCNITGSMIDFLRNSIY